MPQLRLDQGLQAGVDRVLPLAVDNGRQLRSGRLTALTALRGVRLASIALQDLAKEALTTGDRNVSLNLLGRRTDLCKLRRPPRGMKWKAVGIADSGR